jgi:hypothetical protein
MNLYASCQKRRRMETTSRSARSTWSRVIGAEANDDSLCNVMAIRYQHLVIRRADVRAQKSAQYLTDWLMLFMPRRRQA